MNLSKVHHIAIIVSDYEAAKDFYVNKLGLSVIRENYRPERKDWKLDLRVIIHADWLAFNPDLCQLIHRLFHAINAERKVT